MGNSGSFGDELRRLRIGAGLSQDKLAEVAGVTAKTIRALENASGSKARASTLGRLFDALSLSDEKRQSMLALPQGPPTSSAAGTSREADQHPSGPTDGHNVAPTSSESSGIGDLVLELRSALGWTQRELANRAGVHHRTVSDLERGTTTSAQPGTAFRIAQAGGLRGPELDRFVAVATGSHVPGSERPTKPEHLYGRVEELASLVELLAENRLVSIIGGGGIGKTTLAQAARSMVESASVFIEVADQPIGMPLLHALSVALGIDGVEVAELAAALGGYSLVVIDNAEHLTELGETIEALLDELPDLSLLVTSRRPIRCASEAPLQIGPLSPAAAVTLLRQRAAEVGCIEAWVFDDGPYEEICHGVDNLPLAIELAAAWSTLLSPAELLDRLKAPLALLDRRAADSDRHESVRAVVAWSVGLLSDDSRQLFAELSVHPSSFTLEMAEHLHGDVGDLLAVIRELIDAGLVTVVGDETPTRFQMLRVVREAGAEQFDVPERRAVLDQRRSQWALELTAVSDENLTGPAQESWLRRLDLEREHINQAFDHLITGADAGAVDIAAGMWRYWHLRSLYQRGRDRIAGALAVAGADGSPAAATALYGKAVLGYLAGDVDEAVDDAKAALASYDVADDGHGLGSTYSLLGMIDQYRSMPTESERWYRTGLDRVSPRTAARAYATLQANLGSLFGQLGRLEEAITLVEEAIARFESLGDERGVADNSGNMALWELAAGAVDEARSTLTHVLAVFQRIGDPQGEADTRLGLAEAAMFLGDLDLAETELVAADAIIDEINDPWGATLAAAHRSVLLLLSDQTEQALRQARRARIEAEALPYEHALLRAYLVEAVCRVEQGRDRQAADAAARGVEIAGSGNPVITASLALLIAGVAARADDDSRWMELRSMAGAILDPLPAIPLLTRIAATAPSAEATDDVVADGAGSELGELALSMATALAKA